MIDFNKTPMEKFISRIRPRWTYSHFWFDLRYNYWTSPAHKRKLLKNQAFCTWDIVDSIADLTFRQFELYWSESGQTRVNDDNYMKDLKKELRNWYNSLITQQKIYRYITEIRRYNTKLQEETQADQFKFIRLYFIPCENDSKYMNCSTMEKDQLDGYFDISFSFDREDRLSIKKVKPSKKHKRNIILLEDKLSELDDKYLRMIIGNRHYMWR